MDRFNRKLLILIGVLAVINLAIFATYTYLSKYKNTREKVEIVTTDFETKEGFAAVLSAFPSGIPFEYDNITESFSGNYIEHNVIQSGISYTSNKSVEVLYGEYIKFINDNNFIIDSINTNKQKGIIFSSKNNDTLGIVISGNNSVNTVQMSFTDRLSQ